MKTAGLVILVVGIVWIIVAINMNVSVPTLSGGRINNIGLMSTRQNNLIIGCCISICGLLIALLSGKESSSYTKKVKCPQCAELISVEAVKCKHFGSQIKESEDNQQPKSISEQKKSNGFSDVFDVNHVLIFVVIIGVIVIALNFL